MDEIVSPAEKYNPDDWPEFALGPRDECPLVEMGPYCHGLSSSNIFNFDSECRRVLKEHFGLSGDKASGAARWLTDLIRRVNSDNSLPIKPPKSNPTWHDANMTEGQVIPGVEFDKEKGYIISDGPIPRFIESHLKYRSGPSDNNLASSYLSTMTGHTTKCRQDSVRKRRQKEKLEVKGQAARHDEGSD
jgi:hypothetical protein